MVSFPKNPEWSKKQELVLNSSPNTIILGRAGSGKTLLACHIALNKINNANSVLIIVYTKSLKKYIRQYLDSLGGNNVSVMFQYEWRRRMNLINYDYVIIDEFQDLSFQDIKLIIKTSSSGTYLFGDFEQQLYKNNLHNESTLSKEQLFSIDGFKKLYLIDNYRIPRNTIFFITSVFHNANKPNANNHKFKYGLKPKLLQFETVNDELKWLQNFLIENKEFNNIGILLKQNDSFKGAYPYKGNMRKDDVLGILDLYKHLSKQGLNIGYKYSSDENLDFSKEININIMTIHSAKGLEFDCVIIPFSSFINDNYTTDNLLYVSLTRTSKQLIITYTGIISDEYHNNVPSRFYEGQIIKEKKTTGLILKKSGLDAKIYEKLTYDEKYKHLFKNKKLLDTSDCLIIKI